MVLCIEEGEGFHYFLSYQRTLFYFIIIIIAFFFIVISKGFDFNYAHGKLGSTMNSFISAIYNLDYGLVMMDFVYHGAYLVFVHEFLQCI